MTFNHFPRVITEDDGPFSLMPTNIKYAHPNWYTMDCIDMTLVVNNVFTYPRDDHTGDRVLMKLAISVEDAQNPDLTKIIFADTDTPLLYVPATHIRDVIIDNRNLCWFQSDDSPIVLMYHPK